MKIFSADVNSNVESIRKKSSERDFYKYMEERLTGTGLTKIVPFNGIYFDLLYVEKNRVGLFKFMDTSEDTFSILDKEILEVMEEEYDEVQAKIAIKLPEAKVSYHFIMPYVNLKVKNIQKSFIIDNHKFEELINSDEEITSYMHENNEDEIDNIIFKLAKEYFVVKKTVNKLQTKPLVETEVNYKNLRLNAVTMDKEQIEKINDFKYGATIMYGSTGTGKTKVLMSKFIKIARLYPKDNFLYITFDKQLSNELNNYVKYLFPDMKNIRIINYHQFVLLLGKKYNLRLNNKSKQSFNKEFEKVFDKVAKIYSDKRYFKGIFVDESENFLIKDLEFLRKISYSTRNFLYVSYDNAKQMSHMEEKTVSIEEYSFDNMITLDKNYRNSLEIGNFNMGFQDNLEKYKMLELNESEDYFLPFQIESGIIGEVNAIEYKTSTEMMTDIVEKIKFFIEKGYKYSDMCVIYPFNEKVLKGKKHVYSKHLVKKFLEENEIIFSFADDETSNLYSSTGVTLSNIYNVTNLEYKIVFFCQLDVLYNSFNIENKINARKMINIIYTATTRATEKLCIYLKDDETRPGLIDLLKISSIE
ncbi:MAG: UvrD-helicase domain-containing protein [Proteocatella sp.]